MRHPSKDRQLSLLRDRLFLPGMSSDAETWVSNCERCIKRKSKTDIRAPLVNITTTFPLEIACLDYLTLVSHNSHNGCDHRGTMKQKNRDGSISLI